MDESIFDRQLDEQLCFRLYRASNGINKMYGRALKIFQLTFPQYLVLLALWDNDGLPITTIGSQVGMGIGTLNPILKRMTEHDWIEKKTASY
ncbi:MarR family winged helix-turn-helix transcriptional regulator [Jeotgalibaca porci]|uniref:MarR family winged helix-turn-helix transcriptional regulator n=1 Tax=Jeotgalibaca porci TaxID=1868793 RepID=UPI0035A0A2E1